MPPSLLQFTSCSSRGANGPASRQYGQTILSSLPRYLSTKTSTSLKYPQLLSSFTIRYLSLSLSLFFFDMLDYFCISLSQPCSPPSHDNRYRWGLFWNDISTLAITDVPRAHSTPVHSSLCSSHLRV